MNESCRIPPTQLACVKALVSAGAEIPYEDVRGDDALEIARFHGHKMTTSFLLDTLGLQGLLDGECAKKMHLHLCGGIMYVCVCVCVCVCG